MIPGTVTYQPHRNHVVLTENQKNEVGTASRKYYNENKRKHIEMKKKDFFAINDAKLILKYL